MPSGEQIAPVPPEAQVEVEAHLAQGNAGQAFSRRMSVRSKPLVSRWRMPTLRPLAAWMENRDRDGQGQPESERQRKSGAGWDAGVLAAVGCIAIRYDRQVQGDAIRSARACPRPIAARRRR